MTVYPVRRNVILLASGLVCLSGTIGPALGGTLTAVVPALVLLVFRREPEPALELA